MSTNLGIGLSVTRPTRGFDPARLFANGEQGAWYDPSDFATLYQDSAGTTPVTDLGQPVGLMLDKSGNGNHASQATSAARPTVQARVNLLERTEEIGTSPWTVQFGSDKLTITQAQSDPDGGTGASKLVATSVNSTHAIRQSITLSPSTEYTISATAKAAGYNYLALNIYDGAGSHWTFYNLATGEIETAGAGATATISDVGDGWYRCTLNVQTQSSGTPNFVYYVCETDNTLAYAGDDASGILLYAPQLEVGSTATTYQRVTTATDYADIGLPRYLEFDGVDDFFEITQTGFNDTMDWFFGSNIVNKGSDQVMITGDSNHYALAYDPGSSNTVIFQNGTGNDYAPITRRNAATYTFTNRDALNTSITDGAQVWSISGVKMANAAWSTFDFGRYISGVPLSIKGKIHQIIFRDTATAGTLLDQTERFVARKTGVTL